MSATVCIPWRPQPDRIHAYNRVRTFWQALGFPIIEADSTPGLPWHLAEARNNAVRQCDGIVIVADADTLPTDWAIQAAIGLAEDDCVVWPFQRYHYLPYDAVNKAFVHEVVPIWTKPRFGRPDALSVGGVFVTNTDTYWAIGGQDERLQRCWGFEDNCFLAAAETLSTVHRIDADVYAFAHDVDGGRDWSNRNPNYQWNQRYQAAHGDPQAMRELIKR